MINNESLLAIFVKQIDSPEVQKSLSESERNRIVKVFKQALSDPFMIEWQIYRGLIGEESGSSNTLYD